MISAAPGAHADQTIDQDWAAYSRLARVWMTLYDASQLCPAAPATPS